MWNVWVNYLNDRKIIFFITNRFMKCGVIKIIFVKLLDLSGYSARTTSKRPTCRKLAFWGKLSLKILAQLCAGHSILVLLNLTLFMTLRTKANYFQCISQPESFLFNSFSWFHILLQVFVSWAVKMPLYSTLLGFHYRIICNHWVVNFIS